MASPERSESEWTGLTNKPFSSNHNITSTLQEVHHGRICYVRARQQRLISPHFSWQIHPCWQADCRYVGTRRTGVSPPGGRRRPPAASPSRCLSRSWQSSRRAFPGTAAARQFNQKAQQLLRTFASTLSSKGGEQASKQAGAGCSEGRSTMTEWSSRRCRIEAARE